MLFSIGIMEVVIRYKIILHNMFVEERVVCNLEPGNEKEIDHVVVGRGVSEA